VINVRACRFAVLTVLAAVLTVVPARADSQYQFVNFNGPGDSSLGTTVNGINNNGDLVGFSAGLNGNTNFIRQSNGSFTTLSFTGSSTAVANGINNSDQVVGMSGTNAFLLTNGGSNYTVLPSFNGTTASEAAFGINNSGTIVGQYSDSSTGQTPGFVYSGGKFTSLTPFSDAVVTNAQGVNNNGLVTGFYTNFITGTTIDGNLPQQGFFYDTKTGTYILPPNPNVPNFFTVQLLGINDNNIAAGYWQDTAGNQHGLLFNLNTDTYTFLDDPGAVVVNSMQITQITGINDSGEITGFYINANGFAEGFYANAVPEPSSALLLCFGLTIALGHVRHRGRKQTGAR